MLKLGIITDLHFGPEARYLGRLRKMTAEAPALTARFAARMRDEVQPDLVVNLGDCIEDVDRDEDQQRYNACLGILRTAERELVNVAGNHDRIHLTDNDLLTAWQRQGELFYSFDRNDVHVVVLATHENHKVDISIDDAQLEWLSSDLAATRLPTVVLMHHSAADQQLNGNRWFATRPQLCLVRERRELRRRLAEHGRTVLVMNGHLHWNHLAVIDGIPYVTLQSLIENLDDDAPGRPAAAHAVVTVDPASGVHIDVAGAESARYQFGSTTASDL